MMKPADAAVMQIDETVFTPLVPPSGPDLKAGRVRWRLLRHVLMLCLLLAVVIAALAVGRWIHGWRSGIVSTEATLQGVVAQVGTRFDAVVASIDVVPGQRVRAGDVVARLQADDRTAVRDQAQARLAQAAEQLSVEAQAIDQARAEHTARSEVIDRRVATDQAGLEAAEVRLAEANRRLAVLRELQKKKAANDEEIAQAQAAVALARAEARVQNTKLQEANAESRLHAKRSAGLDVREAGLGVLSARVDAACAALAAAQAEVDAAVIRAPADGVVVDRLCETGASVRVGSPVVSLWLQDGRQGDPAKAGLWVEAWVPESRLDKLPSDRPLVVRLANAEQTVVDARVDSVGVQSLPAPPSQQRATASLSLGPKSAWVPVRLQLEAELTDARPGTAVTVHLKPDPALEQDWFNALARVVVGD